MRKFAGGLAATVVALLLIAGPAAAAQFDFSGPAYDILAPGEFGGIPTNQYSTDQGQLYNALTPLEGHVTTADLPRYYLSEKFGVQGPVLRSENTGRPGLTILRDSHDVPHIYGTTRADVMFGSGWVAAEDRGLLLLEGLGPAYLATLDAPGITPFSLVTSGRSFTPSAQAIRFVAGQENVLRRAGAKGRQVLQDLQDWADGINAYEASPEQSGPKLPKVTLPDAIAGFAFIGSIFGNGGGNEVANSDFLARLQRRLGKRAGLSVFRDLREVNDPEAPTTISKAFPYDGVPTGPTPGAMVIDPGSERSAVPGAITATAAAHRLASNFIIAGHEHSADGHPLAVMGPQVSYFSPEILMEEDIHGPGIDAEGAAFPGVNLYVELGHGPDYAWSATSAGQNIIDTFAVRLCSPSGGQASISSDYYLLDGNCVQMQTLTRSESWTQNLADTTPAGSITLQTQRTAYGLVIARARIHGQPVAYTNLRSTYMHELDSAVGFYYFNDPAEMQTPQQFFDAAYQIGYTFNWFYINSQHIAYFNSGHNPVRAPRTDPLFPSWASYTWRGYQASASPTPSTTTEEQTAESAHPHTIDQEFLTSWNNKQAPGYNDAATGQEYASVYRSQLLDENITHYLDAGRMTLTDLINAMGNAGTQDLRGVEVLPYALRIIGTPSNPALANAVDELRAWMDSGAHRINRQNPGASGDYEQSAAVRIMDAWWPLLVKAEFQPLLGSSLLNEIEGEYPINDEPGHGVSGNHLGSSWDVGFYGIVQKDLRSVLGLKVSGPLNRVFCGEGSLTRCRAALSSSLAQAAAESPQQVYPADGVCAAGDQMCSDSIQFRAVGAIAQPLIEWVNRPTFQQAVQIQGP